MAEITTAFWNLQNLFDTTESEIAADLEFTPAEGWTEEALAKKMDNVVEIIAGMFDGAGPDLLGVCEIENESLLQQLADRLNDIRGTNDYVITHHEAADIRGIDCALIYSTEKLGLAGQPEGHLVHFRYPTRDIFEVPLRVLETGAELQVYVTHWPSRIQADSEHFRIAVASHLGRLIDRHLKMSLQEMQAAGVPFADLTDDMARLWNRNVLVMGDLNDDPFNDSVLYELNASANIDRLEEPFKPPRHDADQHEPGTGKIKRSDVARYLGFQAPLYNLSWGPLGVPGAGTIFWDGDPSRTKQVFDQMVISRGLYFGEQGLRMRAESFEILMPPAMLTNSSATEQHMMRPRKFEKSSLKGYSDHFPVAARIEVLDGHSG